ncbi:Vitamin B6 transporter [Komagataella phaffii]|nr:GQ67_02407T0 [Komagataella phaffii]AOA66731.1 GQ68_02840T0 [Komagataella phaffii GS115]
MEKKASSDLELETDSKISETEKRGPVSKLLNGLNYVSKKLDSFGGESTGIERVSPDQRRTNMTRIIIHVMGLWLSGCGGITSMSSFFLGPLIFGLGFKDSMISGLVSCTLGCLLAAYCSTMGPRSGLRQIVSARLFFGPWAVRFPALISAIGFVGWSVTNCVLGGQILYSVSNDKLPIEIGIVIISMISLVIAIFGIRILLHTETLISIPVFTVLILLYIIGSNEYPNYLNTVSIGDTMTIRGNFLSFFALGFSVTATWGGCASDYYTLLPENTNQLFVFFMTFFAIWIPSFTGAVLSILLGNAATVHEPWLEAYTNNSLGGLLHEIFSRWNGFGMFLLVIFFLSLITNNIINTYSGALELQLIGGPLSYFPRWFLSVVMVVIFMVCSLAGRDQFATILSNFLPMLGYWISIYFTLLLEENVIFRSNKTLIKLYQYEFSTIPGEKQDLLEGKSRPYYNFDIYLSRDRLTHGFASSLAFCFGVVGAICGMCQVYYIGPIASKIGSHGADLGMWLAIGFTAVTYPVFRYIELKKFGR